MQLCCKNCLHLKIFKSNINICDSFFQAKSVKYLWVSDWPSVLHTDLKFIFQVICVFHHYSRTVPEDACDLVHGEETLLPQERNSSPYCLCRHSQDLRVMDHHSLKTA